jgi:sodium/bile acid cotransporter 7
MARSTVLDRLRVDPFILGILATVAVACVLPARGGAATVAGVATTVAVGLLFFLYGVRLSPAEALDGLRHWRLHVTVLVATFVMFPLLGLAARLLVPAVLTPTLYAGVLFLCALPSTVQSSIAFTSIAKGNVAAAICGASLSWSACWCTPATGADCRRGRSWTSCCNCWSRSWRARPAGAGSRTG